MPWHLLCACRSTKKWMDVSVNDVFLYNNYSSQMFSSLSITPQKMGATILWGSQLMVALDGLDWGCKPLTKCAGLANIDPCMFLGLASAWFFFPKRMEIREDIKNWSDALKSWRVIPGFGEGISKLVKDLGGWHHAFSQLYNLCETLQETKERLRPGGGYHVD